jgi:hypothetical protein
MPSKTPSIPPLFKADAATLSFYGSKTGAISVSYQGWDASKVVLEGGRCCGGFGIEAVDPLLMTQGCNPLGHLWQPPNTCGLKSPPALPEKDTYGFGVGHLLRAARSGPR